MTSLSLSTLRPARGAKQRPDKRVGRGNASGKGTTAGKGTKGQKARTGGRNRLKTLGMRRLIMSTPKLRGFKSLSPSASPVNLGELDAAYKAGEVVNVRSLKAKGLVPVISSKVKVLGGGSLKKKLVVTGCLVSASAKEAILAAGGEVR